MEQIKETVKDKMMNQPKIRGKIKGFTMIENWFIESKDFSIFEKLTRNFFGKIFCGGLIPRQTLMHLDFFILKDKSKVFGQF